MKLKTFEQNMKVKTFEQSFYIVGYRLAKCSPRKKHTLGCE